MHNIEIPSAIIERIKASRQSLHIFEDVDPAKTAHLIVDLQNGFMAPGQPVEIATAREIVPNVNSISRALRAAGGLNVYIQYVVNDAARKGWSNWYERFFNEGRRAAIDACFAEGAYGWQLWPELDVQPGDVVVQKTRFGAFVPGSSDLHEILQVRGVDTLIITGTATNVCCESTARDAMQMNYKVIFVADGNAASTDAEHNATLSNMAAIFADLMTASEVVDCLAKATLVKQAAE